MEGGGSQSRGWHWDRSCSRKTLGVTACGNNHSLVVWPWLKEKISLPTIPFVCTEQEDAATVRRNRTDTVGAKEHCKMHPASEAWLCG